MITEQQQEQAALFALGILGEEEKSHFTAELRQNGELRELLVSLQRTVEKSVLPAAIHNPPPSLKEKLLLGIRGRLAKTSPVSQAQPAIATTGLKFLAGTESSGWKQLPVPGAFVKLLSLEPSRGYAVLLGKLEPGTRYPAHKNIGPEDFYILTGDLHVGEQVLGPGDFHHADEGSMHTENFSAEGCTLVAVLTVDDPIVQFAMA
jgi:anti-sigma factor ChrR (cupin superfamily)